MTAAERKRTAVAEELRQLTSLRSRASLRDRACPELFALLAPADLKPKDVRYRALTKLLDQGIDSITDPSHHDAARALLGSGPHRWQTLAERGSIAAGAFGCGWDAYRRRRSNGTAQLDDTLDALAEALLARSTAIPAARPTVDPATKTPDEQPPTATTDVQAVTIGDVDSRDNTSLEPGSANDDGAARRPSTIETRHARPRWQIAVLAVAFSTVIGATVWLVAGRDGTQTVRSNGSSETVDDGTAARCKVLNQPVGALPPAATDEMRRWASLFVEFAATQPEAATSCAGPMEVLGNVYLQPVADHPNHGVGAIVSSPVGEPHALLLSHREHYLYLDVVQRFGAAMAGDPIDRDDRSDGTRIVNFTRGALITADYPTSLITGVHWREWLDRGGIDGEMGAPLGSSFDLEDVGRAQDFEGGRLVVDFADPTKVTWTAVADPAAELPRFQPPTVLMTREGVAWLVDESMVRRWLPSSQDYWCATGIGNATKFSDVPAYAIATLEYGEPFRCR